MAEPFLDHTCKKSDSMGSYDTDHESELSQQWDFVEPIGSQAEEAQTRTKKFDRCASKVDRRIKTWDQQDLNSSDINLETTRTCQEFGYPLSPPPSTTETTTPAVPGTENIGNEDNNQMSLSRRTRNATNDAQSVLASIEEQHDLTTSEYATEVPLWGRPSPRTTSLESDSITAKVVLTKTINSAKGSPNDCTSLDCIGNDSKTYTQQQTGTYIESDASNFTKPYDSYMRKDPPMASSQRSNPADAWYARKFDHSVNPITALAGSSPNQFKMGDNSSAYLNKKQGRTNSMESNPKTQYLSQQALSGIPAQMENLPQLVERQSSESTLPLWGKKASKHSSLEDDPDAKELVFAQGNALVGADHLHPHFGQISPRSSLARLSVQRSESQMKKEPGTTIDSNEPHAGSPSGNSVDIGLQKSYGKPFVRMDVNPEGLSEEEMLTAAILASQEEQMNSMSALNIDDIEDAKGNARTIRCLVSTDKIDISFLKTVLSMCKDDQRKIEKNIEAAMTLNSDAEVLDSAHLDTLIDLNGNLLEAIKAGTQALEKHTKQDPRKVIHLDVEALVRKKDIFSLICMLRVHEREKRVDAALALMRFARTAENDMKSRGLRDSIRSSGGLHSLLTLFRNRDTMYELRVVAALAVAYVMPSFVESFSQTPPSLGLKIVECLSFLADSRSVTPNGTIIEVEEMRCATAMALTSFWVNQMEPMLNSLKITSLLTKFESHLIDSRLEDTLSSNGRHIGDRTTDSTGGGLFDQPQQTIVLHELLEMTVSLIIRIANTKQNRNATIDSSSCVTSNSRESLTWIYTLVEQVCAVDVARPIAVRDGILHLLVQWIHSKDIEKIRPAASALSHLTSISDKYMAGWIHSEIVNKGAVQGLADLTHDISVTHDVRLQIVKIISSLCAAPHTRAAVVEANCINFLIGFLYEDSNPSSKEVAYYAGNAILQLAAGAVTRASVFRGEEMEFYSRENPNKLHTLMNDIVDSGVISSFVSIALKGPGKLRLVAVQALRVISEDKYPQRKTRLHLCEDSAAMALGVTLKHDVEEVEDLLKSDVLETSLDEQLLLKEIHEVLCTLANILDPIQDVTSSNIFRATSAIMDPHRHLIKGCLETVESGGLEALLKIAFTPFVSDSKPAELRQSNLELVEEACHSLALLSPLLLCKEVLSAGCSKWSYDLLSALNHVLRQIVTSISIDDFSNRAVGLYVNVLQGICALAKSDALKIRIVENSLPLLLHAKGVRDPVDISNAAAQAFQALDFAEDEVASQVAGNNPNMLADWFCLQRFLILQAMAREEIRHIIHNMWSESFHQTQHSFFQKVIRGVLQKGANDEIHLFENYADDQTTEAKRESILYQYKTIYGERTETHLGTRDSGGLLSKQLFPLNSSQAETSWVLCHANVVQNELLSITSLSEHVDKLLLYSFPSKLLRENVVPLHVLQPDASFNFRALMMPQRRYFSFRREGQLLSRLCDRETSDSADSHDAHWTLVFTNSTFAGEFSESLVQALYLCPMIIGLSFSCNIDYPLFRESESEARSNQNDDGSMLVALLVGSLPPWISHLTFDGCFGDNEMIYFVSMIKTMLKLNAGQEDKPEAKDEKPQNRGQFNFLAICNSPNVSEANWLSFFHLIGVNPSFQMSPSQQPLSTLQALDLSGNKLGDKLSASILEMVYGVDFVCCLEKLDLSDNCIRRATSVLKVLRRYTEFKLSTGDDGKKRRSTLQSLRLASNELWGKNWLEIIALLENDGLELTSLDLSCNDLLDCELECAHRITEALWNNSGLTYLDLSDNHFTHLAIDYIMHRLYEKEYILATIKFDGNFPALSAQQAKVSDLLTLKARRNAIQMYSFEFDQKVPTGAELTTSHTPTQQLQATQKFHDSSLYPAKWEGPTETDNFQSPKADQGENMITVLFSAPLVYNDGKVLRPFAKLDFEMERELIWQCLKEASRDIDLSFDSATHDRLLATMTKRCSCLHYSGHGHQQYLPFEDGAGGPYWFKVDQFKSLIAKEGGAPFRFVFVSACYSYLAGETFASAGVPHVVCCQQESELKDTAALAFTRQFYLSLSIGRTVKESFEQGCKAVRVTPNLKNPDLEMKKFVLLPVDGNHDVPIFRAPPLSEWPKPIQEELVSSNRRPMNKPRLGKSRGLYSGGARSSELSVRNMMQEDPSPSPPQFFLGREVDMYYVLKAVLEKRLVSIVGDVGIGRSSLACALCHYINERASTIITIKRIYFVKARRSPKQNPFRSLMKQLLKKLVCDDDDHHNATATMIEGIDTIDMETIFDEICKVLKHEKALVVFDRAEIIGEADEANEFPMLLSKLSRDTKHVKVLLTNRYPLGMPPLGEHPVQLGPLNFADSVRLFAKNCPFVHTPTDRRKLFDNLVINTEEGELLATDPGLNDTTKHIFAAIGEGVPSKIEKAAYNLTKEEFLKLLARKQYNSRCTV